MPQANITYNAPYNRALVDKIDEMEAKHFNIAGSAYYPSPMGFRLGSYHGEAPRMIGGGSHSQMYISPGNSPAYPPFNMNAGMAVSSGGSHYSGIDGAVGGRRFNILRAVKSIGQKIGKPFEKVVGVNPFQAGYDLGYDVIGPALLGKKVNTSRSQAAGEKVAEKAAEEAAMYALGLGRSGGRKKPNIGKILGSIGKKALPAVGRIAEKVAEKAIVKQLGLGRCGGETSGGKTASLGQAFKLAVIHPDKLLKAKFGGETSGGKKKKPNARAQIVKRIMKERGVKLIEASKIVKAEGLY